MLIMIKSSRITYLSIYFGAKIHKFMVLQRQIHYSTDLSTQREITAKTDKFELNTEDNYVCYWTNTE